MARSSTSWQPGNTASITHGARSPRVREAYRLRVVQEMRELVLAAMPANPPAGDLLLVDFASYALTDVRQLRDYIDARGGLVTDKGVLLKVAEMYRARERDALAILGQLGLSPKARSVLGSATSDFDRARAAQERLRANVAKDMEARRLAVLNGSQGAVEASS